MPGTSSSPIVPSATTASRMRSPIFFRPRCASPGGMSGASGTPATSGSPGAVTGSAPPGGVACVRPPAGASATFSSRPASGLRNEVAKKTAPAVSVASTRATMTARAMRGVMAPSYVTTDGTEIRPGSALLEVFRVDRDLVLLVRRDFVGGVDRVHRADGLAGATVDADVRIDEVLLGVVVRLDAVDGAF